MWRGDTHPETGRGVFLAVLVLIAAVIIAVPLIRRKMKPGQLLCAVILSAAMIFWFVRSLGEYVVFGGAPSISMDNFIPFGTVFVSDDFIAMFASGEEFSDVYLMPQVTRLLRDLAMGLVWGALAPAALNAKTIKGFMCAALFVLIPLELAVNVLFLLGSAYNGHYDMGSYIMLAAGCAAGRLIYGGIAALFKGRSKTRDNGK